MFYDKVHELVRELKNSEEYKNYLSLKNELKNDAKAYEMLKDFKKKQEEHQLNYINGQEMAQEELAQMQNLYSLIIQNETSRKLLESEMKLNVMLADMNKIVGEGLRGDSRILMSIKSKYELYVKGKNEEYDIREIISNLPNNNIITKDTLEKLNNKTTKMISDDDMKGNYYVFLNDTIYLSNKNTSNYNRLTVICHECIHSMQNKMMQLINFIFSNLEILIFAIFAVLKFLNIVGNILTYVYIAAVIISLIPRFILEIHASLKSIKLTKEYVNEKVGTKEAEFVNKIVKIQVIILLPIMLFSLCFWKIVRILFLAII